MNLYIFSSKGSRKKKVHPLVAGPLRKKELFFKFFFFILLPYKNKNYFTLDNLSKYGHITLKFVFEKSTTVKASGSTHVETSFSLRDTTINLKTESKIANVLDSEIK